MNEQRFAVQYRTAAEDEPGLVLGEDGSVYVVGVNGSRTALGGASGGKLDPFTTVSAGAIVLNAATDSLTIESGEGTTGVLIQNTGAGPVKISAGAGGIDIGEFGDAAYIKMLSAAIDIHSAVGLVLHSSSVATLESASAHLYVGTDGTLGNGGLKAVLPSNGATPTLDLNVNSGAAQITGNGAGQLVLTAGEIDLVVSTAKIKNGSTIGLEVDIGGGEAAVTIVGDSGGTLAFFGTTPKARIPGSTLTTVAQVVGALQSYGLLG